MFRNTTAIRAANRRNLYSLLYSLLALGLAVGCTGDDDDDDDDGGNADDSGSGTPGSASNADSNATDPSADGGESTSNASAADSGGTCEGDWSLGSVPFVGDGILVPCDENPPKNCADGGFIVFNSTDECICLPECSSLQGVGLGDACDANGTVVCQAIRNNSGSSSGEFCTPTQWNLCGP